MAQYYRFDLFTNFTFFLNDPVNGDGIQQSDRRVSMAAISDTSNGQKCWACRASGRLGFKPGWTIFTHASDTQTKSVTDWDDDRQRYS